MPFGEVFRVAFDALRVNKLRSLLTMLGIIIGVSAVIAMLALGRGAQEAVNSRIAALGTTLVSVSPGQVFFGGVASSTDRARLVMSDYEALLKERGKFAAVEAEMQRNQQVQYRDRNASTTVIGTTPNYSDVRRYAIAAGRMFTAQDDIGRKRVAVIGATAADNLGMSADEAIGQSVRINGVSFEVIGLFALKGSGSGFGDPDDQIVIPLGTARFRLFGTENLNSINVLAPNENEILSTMATLQRVLRREHRIPRGRPDDFRLRNQADFLQTLGETTQIFTLLLAGIAAVSLLVGGIGIMNIMLVSVTERTREIGIRKALGATRKTILAQFLIEAVVLCSAGGVIGIALGAGTAYGLRRALDWNTTVDPTSVALAFVFSAVVGVLFGVWPARRAASLDPIQALRYE
jgi:putative ABC transport system permease protein